MYHPRIKYSERQLAYAYLKDLIVDIRCARLDHCEANPLLNYAEKCVQDFRYLWAMRHTHSK